MAKKGKNRKVPTAKNLSHRWRKPPFSEWARHLATDNEVARDHKLLDGFYDFRYCAIKKKIAHGLDVAHSDFTKASFYRSDISHSVMTNARCIRTDFTEAVVNQVDFSSADLRGARFCRASMVEANLTGASAIGADFAGADLAGVVLEGADLSNATLSRCRNVARVRGLPTALEGVVLDRETLDSLKGTEFGALLESAPLLDVVREYDVAISFAGEDRELARAIANGLKGRNVGVFYDEYESADMWGKNLYDHLSSVYKDRAHYCVLLVSQHYRDKLWTNHERRSAQARAFAAASEYILPLRLDDTKIVGVLDTVGYVDARAHSVDTIVKMIVQKLKSRS